MTDIAALVDGAKAKGTFSVLDAIEERSYPQDIRTVYTAAEAAYNIKRLEAINADEKDTVAHEERVAEIDRLKGIVAASALTFRMRGIGQGTKDAIDDEGLLLYPEERDALGNVIGGGIAVGPGAEWNNAKVFAEHIIDVTDFEGNVDEHHWSVDEVKALRAKLPEESYKELVNLVFELSFAAAYFDASVTPDFS